MGIVRSDFIEVEINLKGPAWAAAIKDQLKLDPLPTLPLKVSVNKVGHPAELDLEIRGTIVAMRSEGAGALPE